MVRQHGSKLALWASCLGLACATVTVAEASDWPRFRGVNGTGISTDKNVPVEFEPAQATWKTPIPGTGNSSPIVFKERIFLQTSTPDAASRQLLCLNLLDGKIIWSKTAPGGVGKTHKKNSLASCSAATDGKTVVAPFWDGASLSVSAFAYEDGKLLWTQPLGGFTSQHGPGHSPVLYQGKVFLSNDQDGSSVLVALDLESGKIAWQAERLPHRACYSTPFLLEGPNGAELIVASTTTVAAYSPDKGTLLWKWGWEGNKLRTVASPVVNDGILYVTSGDGSGARHFIALKLDRKGTNVDVSIAWEEKKTFPYVPSMIAQGDYLYTINDGGIASCYIGKTGEKVWQERLGGGVSASPILVGGNIYSASEDGIISVFTAGPTFKMVAKNDLGESIMATPAVADGRLLIRGKNSLFCFGKGTSVASK